MTTQHYYAVFGNPIEHSLSPKIHTQFAKAEGLSLRFEKIKAPIEGFEKALNHFKAQGGEGASVTLPFKRAAFHYADTLSERAKIAQAVNTLIFTKESCHGDNTDGIGLVTDLTQNKNCNLQKQTILILGAGGATQGILGPLLEAGPTSIVLANRTVDKAHIVAERFAAMGNIKACALDAIPEQQYGLVINATSAGVNQQSLLLPQALFHPKLVCYDCAYGKAAQPFLSQAQQAGVLNCYDGWGMLVEQAAQAFKLWFGVQPPTQPLLALSP